MTHNVVIRTLSTGYYHARGVGPCNWAQWPVGEQLNEAAFFVHAGPEFRKALYRRAKSLFPDPKEGAA